MPVLEFRHATQVLFQFDSVLFRSIPVFGIWYLSVKFSPVSQERKYHFNLKTVPCIPSNTSLQLFWLKGLYFCNKKKSNLLIFL